jgi:hypothetical protein
MCSWKTGPIGSMVPAVNADGSQRNEFHVPNRRGRSPIQTILERRLTKQVGSPRVGYRVRAWRAASSNCRGVGYRDGGGGVAETTTVSKICRAGHNSRPCDRSACGAASSRFPFSNPKAGMRGPPQWQQTVRSRRTAVLPLPALRVPYRRVMVPPAAPSRGTARHHTPAVL